MKTYKYPSEEAQEKIDSIVNRGEDLKKDDLGRVGSILEDVKKRGDSAIVEYTKQFDCPDFNEGSIKISDDEINKAFTEVDIQYVKALESAAINISDFHQRQVRESWITTDRQGTVLGQSVNPVGSAGIYVPGGLAGNTPLVSSLLMGVIPARIAGVDTVSVATPSKKDGSVSPYMLIAAKIAQADGVYRAGSAWGIGALAYGTATIPRADVIAGPGNIFVTMAKKLVSGFVGIDMVAGPSEILVIADETADPEFIAADMLSQAEHDPLASAILLTDSQMTADKTINALNSQLARLLRKETAEKSIKDFGAVFVVETIDDAVELSNRIAPEHLEIITENASDVMGRIKNAGAVFVGAYTPEPVGDYFAGPNHVLPTAGAARFSSALGVETFVKRTSIIHYSKPAFDAEAEDIIRIAEIEGLDAHAASVKVRMK